ncbi:MAG: hypothetical protein LBO62_04545 [Endomicrobium sp.]|nr:hypothetical protein [Endomicrobium sp.]
MKRIVSVIAMSFAAVQRRKCGSSSKQGLTNFLIKKRRKKHKANTGVMVFGRRRNNTIITMALRFLNFSICAFG